MSLVFKLTPTTREIIDLRGVLSKLYKTWMKTGNEHFLYRCFEIQDIIDKKVRLSVQSVRDEA